MRLELMTYALRKRRREVAIDDAVSSYVDRDCVVAPMVALGSPERDRESVTLPDDLSEVVQLWPGLSNEIRNAVLAIIRQSSNG